MLDWAVKLGRVSDVGGRSWLGSAMSAGEAGSICCVDRASNVFISLARRANRARYEAPARQWRAARPGNGCGSLKATGPKRQVVTQWRRRRVAAAGEAGHPICPDANEIQDGRTA